MMLGKIGGDVVGAGQGQFESGGAAHGPPSGGVRPPSVESRKFVGLGQGLDGMSSSSDERGTRFGLEGGSSGIGGRVGPQGLGEGLCRESDSGET